MLIQVDNCLYNQDRILGISFSSMLKGTINPNHYYMHIQFDTNSYKDFEILSLYEEEPEVRYDKIQEIGRFLGKFFGKRGIKLTLSDPNKIGMTIYD